MVAAGIENLGLETYLLAVIVCGVVQIAAGFLKAGVIAHYFPSSVIKGMLAGIGIILILKADPSCARVRSFLGGRARVLPARWPQHIQ